VALKDRQTIRLSLRLFRFAAPHWKLIAITFVAASTYAALEGYYLLLIEPLAKVAKAAMEAVKDGNLTGIELRPEDLAALDRVKMTLLWLVAPVVAATWLSEYLQGVTAWRVVVDIRNRICQALLPQSLRFFEDRRSGDLISRISNDVSVTQKALTFLFGDLFLQPARLAVAVGIAVYASWQLTLLSLLVAPLFIVPLHTFTRKVRRAGRRSLERLADVTDALTQIFSGIRIVKAFKMEEAEVEEFRQVNDRFLGQMRKVLSNAAHGQAVMEFFIRLLIWGMVAAGSALLAKQTWGLTPGKVVLFAAALFFAYQPLRKLIKSWNNLQEALAGTERIFEIIDSKPEIADAADAVDLAQVRQGVRFKNVVFSYGGEPVIRDLSLDVRAGQTVAIVGRSGSGKTTLMNLLLRFYDVCGGAIEIDGIDVRQDQAVEPLDRVAIVSQQTFLFNRTIAENIRYGRRDASDEEVRAAAKAANIHDFIVGLPEGYETKVGEFGVKLSGGQRQRLAIARAVLKNPDILILDEAMVGLDADSESLVRQALMNLMKGRTTFVVSHDLKTIERADLIVVISKGQIVQMGRHAELYAQGGEYRTLYDLQMAETTKG